MSDAAWEGVADAEHELRGPAAALGMLAERIRRDPEAHAYADSLDAQLARLRRALDDLAAARGGGPAPRRNAPVQLEPLARGAFEGVGAEVMADWRAGRPRVVADRGRLAQALGNLLANADEHGEGPIEVRGRRVPGAVRVEIRNRARPARPRHGDPGRGLPIARAAAASAGGRLELAAEDDQVVAILELPVEDSRPDAA